MAYILNIKSVLNSIFCEPIMRICKKSVVTFFHSLFRKVCCPCFDIACISFYPVIKHISIWTTLCVQTSMNTNEITLLRVTDYWTRPHTLIYSLTLTTSQYILQKHCTSKHAHEKHLLSLWHVYVCLLK